MAIISSFLTRPEREREPTHHVCLLEQCFIAKGALLQSQDDFSLTFALDFSASEVCKKLEALMGHAVLAVLLELMVSLRCSLVSGFLV